MFVLTRISLSISLVELQSDSRVRILSDKRALVTLFVIKYAKATFVEMAHWLRRSPVAIRKVYIKIKSCPEKYFDADLLSHIDATLNALQRATRDAINDEAT